MSRTLSYKIRKPFAKIIFFIIDFINTFKPNYYFKVIPAKYMESYYVKIKREDVKSTLEAAYNLGLTYKQISKKTYESINNIW